METFFLMIIALGFVMTAFGIGILLGMNLRRDVKAENIRQVYDQAVNQIGDTVDYYRELQKYILQRMSSDHK